MTIDHGTPKGYGQHRLVGEPPCRDCLDAWNASNRDRRRRDPNVKAEGRRKYAHRKTLAAFRDLAPDLYAQLYSEAVAEWDRDNPVEGSTP